MGEKNALRQLMENAQRYESDELNIGKYGDYRMGVEFVSCLSKVLSVMEHQPCLFYAVYCTLYCTLP